MTKLETLVANYIGSRYAIQVGTGTAALTLALKALGIGKGHEVIVPSIVCYSVPFAVLYSGAEPIFCDVDPMTLNIDPESLHSVINNRTKAIIAVHLFGYPCNIKKIKEIADSHQLYLIEDFAQGFGGRLDEKYLGSFGVISITSFGKDKILDAGGGGIILTNEPDLARQTKKYADILPFVPNKKIQLYRRFYTAIFGLLKVIDGDQVKWRKLARKIANIFQPLFLYRLSAFQEERIIAQLSAIEDVLTKRYSYAKFWKETLQHPMLTHLGYELKSDIAYMKYTCILNGLLSTDLLKPWDRGPITTLYPPMHLVFSKSTKLPIAESVAGRLINFPTSPVYSLADLKALKQRFIYMLNKAISQKFRSYKNAKYAERDR
jgi:dTDP-4-amino-4,6-dideoxygalactose transaminase